MSFNGEVETVRGEEAHVNLPVLTRRREVQASVTAHTRTTSREFDFMVFLFNQMKSVYFTAEAKTLFRSSMYNIVNATLAAS